MNVKIKTVYGELSFNMTQDKALALISTAHTYDEAYANERNDALPALALATEALAEVAIPPIPINTKEEPNAPPKEKPAPKSRLESLFGEKAAWKMPKEPSAPAPEKETEDGAEPEEYKGFLYIECEKCGAIKGFCIKNPITHHKCECGHETELRGLRPAHVRCECNSRFTYSTNLRCESFTIDCLHCGSPVDMELGGKGTAFVTIAFSEMYKKKRRDKR